jgi:TfoX/Sxy family transcriptional regulator of competence genes
VEEKKMFGGLCFMVNDKMCVGVETNRLMVRLDPSKVEEVRKKKDANQWTLPAK